MEYHIKYYGCATIVMLGVLFAVVSQGSFLQIVLLLCAVIGLVPFACLLAVFFLIARIRKKAISNNLKFAFLAWAVCAGTIILSYSMGSGIRMVREKATLEYVAQAIIILDGIKISTGSYPPTLPAIVNEKSLCLRFSVFYSSDGKTFRFAYDDTAGLMDGYEIGSIERIWHHYGA
jgi:energy-coupling factor transporter transmembrane protein EcfT